MLPNAAGVREFAVSALKERAADAQLLSYLLPLSRGAAVRGGAAAAARRGAALAALLIERAAAKTPSWVGRWVGMSLRAARDGADGVIEKMREAWLRQQEVRRNAPPPTPRKRGARPHKRPAAPCTA